jgi:glycosyltransferase involved in cell wall biosynthesis
MVDGVMRVVMVGAFPLDWQNFAGGVESHMSYLAHYLPRAAPLDLHIVTLASSSQQGIVTRDGLTVYYEPSARLDTWCLWLRHRRRLATRIASLEPDLVHAHIAGQYALAAFQSGYPTVLTLHGIRHREARFYRGLRTVARGKLIGLAERMSVRRARHIISISPYIEETFGDLIRARLYPVEIPVDERFFQISGPSQANCVLFVGQVIARKGVLELLQAVKQARQSIPDVELRIAGPTRADFDPTYFDRLQKYVNVNGLTKAVRFLGQLDQESVLEEYKRCQVLALSSFQETAPAVVAQAMAARRAVVATRVGGVPHMVSDGQAGLLVNPGDVDGLAEALTRLLKEPRLRHKLEEQAWVEANQRFHPAVIARQTIAVYREVLKAEG